MISVDEAHEIIASHVRASASQDVPLAEAGWRTLAEPVVARSAAPRSDVAAMDGYAVHDGSTSVGAPLQVIGESRAGAGFEGPLQPGEAVRIFTGAAMPQGADRCIMQEYATRDGDFVRFTPGYGPGWHVRSAGSDFAAGERLLDAGTRLSPRALVTAAAADRATLRVAARPVVAIIGTGDELAPPGEASHRAHAIPESVTYGVSAMAQQAGAQVAARLLGEDNLPALERLADDVLDRADVVVVIGGASVGERDFAKPMFESSGLQLLFSKVAMKPGRPVWLGQARGKWVLGLPGNPVSAMVTARMFLIPLLAAMQGQPIHQVLEWRILPLAGSLPATDTRETFARASWQLDGACPLGRQESGAQRPLAQADLLIRLAPQSPACGPGDPVQVLMF